MAITTKQKKIKQPAAPDTLRLSYTWLIYTGERQEMPYVEVAEVMKNGLLGTRKALSPKRLQNLCKSIQKSNQAELKGYIESELFYMDMNPLKPVLMWRTPADIKTMYFTINEVKSGSYPVPPLIWMLQGNSLSLYAYKMWKGLKTELFMAPFPNTRPMVCLGAFGQSFLNKKVDNVVSPQEVINAAEYIFWNTAFTEATETTVTPHNVLYKKLYNLAAFPKSELITTKKQLSELW